MFNVPLDYYGVLLCFEPEIIKVMFF